MNPLHFLVLGNENRQKYLARILKEKGHEVMCSEKYLPGYHDAILLPVPQTGKYLEENKEHLQKGQTVYGCHFPKETVSDCTRRGIRFVDYLDDEGAAERNAVATAEGAIAEALLRSCQTLQNSRVLVTGYGCCGVVLASKLLSWKADVTVMERKERKRAAAESFGCHAVSFQMPPEQMKAFDFIFNTVPAPVLTKEKLIFVRQEVPVIDIASKPGGVDFEFCQKRGINAVLCLGLPGKYAPKSSAGILVEVIEKTILGDL